MRTGGLLLSVLLALFFVSAHAAEQAGIAAVTDAVDADVNNQDADVDADSEPLEILIITPKPFQPSFRAGAELSQVSAQKLDGDTVRKLAGSSGDPLRALQTLPGVVTVSGSSAPAVRGSGPGDNIYYVDGLRTAKLFHFGSISVFNADLIKDFDLYSAAFSPNYGDVTGAVVDVALRDPRADGLHAKINTNLIGSDFLVEGPGYEGQSFYFAARRSYIDLLIDQVEQDGVTVQIPNYWDYQGKYLWQLNETNKLAFHLHGAGDEVSLNIAADAESGQKQPILVGSSAFSSESAMQAVTLDTLLANGAINKMALQHSTILINNALGTAGFVNLKVNNVRLGDQVEMKLGRGHQMVVGAELINSVTQVNADFIVANCTQFNPNCDLSTANNQKLSDEFNNNLAALFVQSRKRITEPLTLVGGLRYSNENYANSSFWEPRLALEWESDGRTTYTAGWGRHHQSPTGEQWAPKFGNPELKNTRAEHSVLGVKQVVNADWDWKVEVYHKKFDDLVVNDPVLNYINAASGKAYGLEILINKAETDRFSGWWVLNLAKSLRKNDVTGESFRFQFDQPVNTTLVGNVDLGDNWAFGMKWHYHSGSPYTPITGTNGNYPDGRPIPVYAAVNSDSLPAYHQLDIRLDRNYEFDQWQLNTYIEFNNVYQRRNVVGYNYTPDYATREPVYDFVLPISFGVQAEF